ncbi:isochorismate synthase [Marinifilum sp. D737]|uniref:isochorismate synthase n=1 Tax=Marinifilum sp. D737 TaxID=2969628 RepID=UPI0022744848|nr:isochorismate synthase [Marinifilum sp. D737]MCY1635332.1 isochorismate synthase [Marinifilum sp. D737]
MSQLEDREKSIQYFLEQCLQKRLSFYAYSLPGDHEIKIGIQTSPSRVINLLDLKGKEGFLFAPFDLDEEQSAYFIDPEFEFSSKSTQFVDFSDLPDQKDEDSEVYESSKEDYLEQIKEMLADLKSKKLDKVILSRVHVLNGKGRKDAASIFLRLNKTYPNAFVSMIDIPSEGLWIGASPERFLNSDGKTIETVALAGTQKLGDSAVQSVEWEKKEIEEQAYVSKYIEELLSNYQIDDYQKQGPFTVQAGNVVHLKTTYKANTALSFDQISSFAQALHPTPAVCGLPKNKAMDLIRKVEKHKREYYAGFLGPIHADGGLALFVNLRSMKVLQESMALFVGGGITADSDPEKEWMETCFKAQTLLKVIK